MGRQRHIVVVSCVIIMIAVFVNVIGSPIALAHRDGYHRWHSCPSDTGKYVCGDLGYTSECPAAPAAPAPRIVAPTPAPVRVPVVTMKTEIRTDPIIRTTKTVYTTREYPDFTKVMAEGEDGSQTVSTAVTYTNGKETGRAPSVTTIVKPMVPKVVQKGSRAVPTAVIKAAARSKVGWFNSHQNETDVSGATTPDTKLLLRYKGKFIACTTSDGAGNYVFVNVPAVFGGMVGIYKDLGDGSSENPHAVRVSEPTMIKVDQHVVKTEYAALHAS